MYECSNLFSGMIAYACNKCHLVTEIPTIKQLTNITASFPKRSLCHTKRCIRFAVRLPSILSHPIELTNWEILLYYMYWKKAKFGSHGNQFLHVLVYGIKWLRNYTILLITITYVKNQWVHHSVRSNQNFNSMNSSFPSTLILKSNIQ